MIDPDQIARQVRGVVFEAIHEAMHGDRAPSEIADEVARRTYDLVEIAQRAALTDDTTDWRIRAGETFSRGEGM